MLTELLNPLILIPVIIIIALVYYLIPLRFRWVFLLAVSYAFYFLIGKWAVVLLAFSALINYLLGRRLAATSGRTKGYWLVFGILLNVLVLAFFKYFSSLLSPQSLLVTLFSSRTGSLLLPVGLSFYTVQHISYLVDVSKGLLQPERNPGIFALYSAFFPKVISGPIERGRNLLPQLKKPEQFKFQNLVNGGELILLGLFEKLVIADRLAIFVDEIFHKPTTYWGFTIVIVLVFLSFQIYFDFAGYSNIALGIARILGINLTVNFKRPYLSLNIVDFWNRWHLSFSTWLRDYIFYPSRRFLVRNPWFSSNFLALILPPMITMLISGLWHGTGITFLLWGLYHAIFYTLTIVYKNYFGARQAQSKLVVKIAGMLINFGVLTGSWVLFRAESVLNAKLVIRYIFYESTPFKWLFVDHYYFDFWAAVALLVIVLTAEILAEFLPQKFGRENLPRWGRWAICVFELICVTLIGVFPEGGTPFIYGQF